MGSAGADAVSTASRTDKVFACYRRCVGNQDGGMAKLASGCLDGCTTPDGVVTKLAEQLLKKVNLTNTVNPR